VKICAYYADMVKKSHDASISASILVEFCVLAVLEV